MTVCWCVVNFLKYKVECCQRNLTAITVLWSISSFCQYFINYKLSWTEVDENLIWISDMLFDEETYELSEEDLFFDDNNSFCKLT